MKRSNLVAGSRNGVFKVILSLFLMLAVFAGCINLVKGEFFLSGRQYEQGEEIFREEVIKKPDNDENWYYLGRFLLAQDKYREANVNFKKAAELNPYEARNQFWLGVSYGGLGKLDAEIRSYKKAINLDPDNSQAYTYLGHSFFRQKKYEPALENYTRALTLSENNPSAIYNQALIFYRIKKFDKSRTGFKRYLEKYGYSPRSVRAAGYLNQMGDFEYRVHFINKKKIVLKKLAFSPEKQTLTRQSRESLEQVVRMMSGKKDLELHVLAFEKNNVSLAKNRALQIKDYLETFFSQMENGSVEISFFGEPEKIRVGKKYVVLDSSINFFAVPKHLIK